MIAKPSRDVLLREEIQEHHISHIFRLKSEVEDLWQSAIMALLLWLWVVCRDARAVSSVVGVSTARRAAPFAAAVVAAESWSLAGVDAAVAEALSALERGDADGAEELLLEIRSRDARRADMPASLRGGFLRLFEHRRDNSDEARRTGAFCDRWKRVER